MTQKHHDKAHKRTLDYIDTLSKETEHLDAQLNERGQRLEQFLSKHQAKIEQKKSSQPLGSQSSSSQSLNLLSLGSQSELRRELTTLMAAAYRYDARFRVNKSGSGEISTATAMYNVLETVCFTEAYYRARAIRHLRHLELWKQGINHPDYDEIEAIKSKFNTEAGDCAVRIMTGTVQRMACNVDLQESEQTRRLDEHKRGVDADKESLRQLGPLIRQQDKALREQRKLCASLRS